jgi:hypothetical protein
MNNDFNELLNKLEKRKNTHPNLINFWKMFLEEKQKNIEKTFLHCEHVLDHMDTISDIDIESVITLLHIFRE